MDVTQHLRGHSEELWQPHYQNNHQHYQPRSPALAPVVFIYGLADPRDGEIRYIGKTVAPDERLRQHTERRAYPPNNPLGCWLKELHATKLQPIMVCLEVVPQSRWAEREIYYIKAFRDAGSPLTNVRKGGQPGTISQGAVQ